VPKQILGGPDKGNIDLLLDRANFSLPKPQVSRPGRKQARRLPTGIGSLGETRSRLGVGCVGPGGLSSLSFPLAEERTQVQFLRRQVSNYLE